MPVARQPAHSCIALPIAGFSLVELSLVLLVIGLLTSAALQPLGSVLERSRERTTQRQLEAVREALIGQVIATGVLPCPRAAQTPAGGHDDHGEPAICTVGSGFLPNHILGLSLPADESGVPVDAWGRRLHYAVSLASHAERGRPDAPDWTSPGELAAVGLGNVRADLSICSERAAAGCPRRALRAGGIVAVIWSVGADDSASGIQQENLDGDTVFAAAAYSRRAASRFDDHLLWLSHSELSYWLLRANRLD